MLCKLQCGALSVLELNCRNFSYIFVPHKQRMDLSAYLCANLMVLASNIWLSVAGNLYFNPILCNCKDFCDLRQKESVVVLLWLLLLCFSVDFLWRSFCLSVSFGVCCFKFLLKQLFDCYCVSLSHVCVYLVFESWCILRNLWLVVKACNHS